MITADDSLDSGTMSERVVVVLDVRNVTAGQNRAYCNTEIDYDRLRRKAVGDGTQVAAVAVDSLIMDGERDTAEVFHNQLRRSGFDLQLERMYGESEKQQGVDVHIALVAQEYAIKGLCDRIVLITGDGDFNTLAKCLHRHGVKVTVASFDGNLNKGLKKIADSLICLDALPMVRMQPGRILAEVAR